MLVRRCLAVLFGLALVGCEAPPEGTWVTRLTGVDAWLGISVDGDQGAAFVCGGETALDTHTRWMLTSVTADKITFAEDDWTLEVNLSEGDAGGQLVEPSGAAVAFEAARVGEEDVAGLYFGFDSGCGDGLIVLPAPSTQAPEALGAWCDTTGLRERVTPVLPIELTADGIAAFVDLDAGRRDFVMAPVDPRTVTP